MIYIKFFDSHTHINNDKLFLEAEKYIRLAKEENIVKMNIVGYDELGNDRVIKLIDMDESIYGSVGFHPVDVKGINNEKYDKLKKQLNLNKIIALGEIGFDYHWKITTKEEQREAFATQLDIANEVKKPIVIHIREAVNDTYEMLKLYNGRTHGGVIHCFSGSIEMAKKFIDLGYYISFAGPITFLNAKTPKEVAKVISLENILIETDAPYLSPHPFRGKLNTPSMVKYVAEEIAKIKNISIEEVAEVTFSNANKCFNIK